MNRLTYIQANLHPLNTIKFPFCFGVKLRLFIAGNFQLYFAFIFSKQDIIFDKDTL